jgi:hypothetical protein
MSLKIVFAAFLLSARLSAADFQVHPVLEPYQANPVLRAAVQQQLADWRPSLTAQLPAEPTAEIARQYVTILKANQAEIGPQALTAVLGENNARALDSLHVEPKELAAAGQGAQGIEQWTTRFNQTFDHAAAAGNSTDAAPVVAEVPPAAASGLLSAPKESARPSAEDIPSPRTVVFLTDFGLKDPAVGICKLVMSQINEALRIIDLSHLIPPFNVRLASDFLAAALHHAKPGTVFVAVVDPGVGSARRSVAVRTAKGHLLVGPDNGLFAKAVAEQGLDQAVEITNPAYFYKPAAVSSTFHGRDIYAPVGAHLASGVPLEEIGPKVTQLTPLQVTAPQLNKGEIHGEVVYLEDPFGSVLTDIPKRLLEDAGWGPGVTLEIGIGGRKFTLPYGKTFSNVPRHEPLALIHSRGVLSFSINQGNFAHDFDVKEGAPVVVRAVRAD